MKKRVLSLFMALALCLSMTPTVSYAEETGAVTEQEAQSGESITDDTSDVYTTGNENTGNDVSGNDVSGNDVSGNDVSSNDVSGGNADVQDAEKGAAVQAARIGRHANHPVCGDTSCKEHGDDVTDWTALSYDETSGLMIDAAAWNPENNYYVLPKGNYYLENDLVISAGHGILINEKVNLCLNGHSITQTSTGNDYAVCVIDTFSLCDCSNGKGSIIQNSSSAATVYVKGTFNMYGGTISGGSEGVATYYNSVDTCFNMYGGTISGNKEGVQGYSGGSFNMYGGEISGNTRGVTTNLTASNSVIFNFNMFGGVICGNTESGVYIRRPVKVNIHDGEISGNMDGGVYILSNNTNASGSYTDPGDIEFNMYGGKISGNSGSTGGVYMQGTNKIKVKFNMSGGEISGNNTAVDGDGNVYVADYSTLTVSGTARIQNNWIGGIKDGSAYVKGDDGKAGNVYLPSGKKITIGESGLEAEASIGVTYGDTSAEGAIVATGTDNGYQYGNITSDDTSYKVWKAGNDVQLTTAILLEHPICGEICNHTDSHVDEMWKEISNLSEITSGGCYHLMSNVNLSGTWECKWDVKLCLNGHSITQNASAAVIKITEDGKLTLTDCKDGGKLTHTANVKGTGVYVASKGTLIMYGGSITGNANTSTHSGGGVYVAKEGTFTMYGGSISDNTNEYNYSGGGVYVAGTFTMDGGDITGNENTDGTNSGGGVVVDGGTFKMSNGKITKNTSKYNGGGIYIYYSGTFTMDGGSISENESTERGGGVYVAYNGTFAMSNGKITGNTAGGFEGGGGVCVGMNGVFTMDGGKITGNNTTSSSCAGGVYVNYDSTFTVSGEAQITGNWRNGKANNEGIYGPYINSAVGNVYLVGGDATMATITIGEELKQSAEIGVSISEKSLPTTGNNVKIATGATNNELNYAGIFKLDMDDQSYSVIRDNGDNLVICPHQHNWGYEVSEADSATINAICKAKGCPNINGGSVTIKAPAELTYDGKAKAATLDGAFTNGESNPEISYKDKNGADLEAAPTDAGSYTANITVGGVTASVGYTIESATLTGSDFTFNPPTDLVYSGTVKTATVGSDKVDESCISVKYYNENGTEVEPKNVGRYTVKIDVKKSQNYEAASELTGDGWSFNITPATITVTPDADQSKIYGDSDPVLTYTYTGAVNGETPAFTGKLSREAGEKVREKYNICKYAIKMGDLKLTDGEGFIAGNYKLELSSTEVSFTIGYRSVTVTGITANDKTYDGTTDVTFDYTNVKLEGVLKDDDLTVTVSGAFKDKNVGENKSIEFIGAMLQGDSASNYTLGADPIFTADITPKELAIKDVTVANKTYDGTTEATVTDVTFEGFVDGESSVDYTASGKFEDATVGTGKKVTATVTLTAGGNYTLPENSYTKTGCVISKATVSDPKAEELIITNKLAKTYTFPLSSSLPTLTGSMEYGKVTYSIDGRIFEPGYFSGSDPAWIDDNGQLNLPILATQKTDEGKVGTITVKVTSDNVEDFILTINVIAKNKIVPHLEGTLTLSPEEITYGDALSKITGISGTMRGDNNEMVSGKFTWKDGSITPVVGDGTYTATWKFTPDDTETYEEATGTVTIKVNKAAQSGTVSMDDYIYNAAPGEPKLKDRTGDDNAEVTYYYSTTDSNKDGTKWENIGKTTLNAGTYYMYAVIGATANYNAFTTQAVKFVVEQATPEYTKPTGVTAKYGQKLGDIKLTNPEGAMAGEWSWQTDDKVLDTIGVSRQFATFKPKDPNYEEVSNIAIEVTVEKAAGGNLGTVELTQAFNDSSDHTYTPDWSGLPAGQTWSYGYEPGVSNNITKLETSAKNVTYAISGGKAGDKFTVTLKASCENYEDFTITLNITITKAIPTGAPAYTEITTGDRTLADANLTLTGSTLSPADGKLEWIDGDETPVEVNTKYTWRFTPADSDNYESLTGEIELYHVDIPVISSQPTDASVKVGEKAVFEVAATGTDLTYQWQIDRNDGKGFVKLDGANSASYTSGVTDLSCNGFKYQCIISNAAGSVTTETATLTVTEYKIIEGADSSWTQNVDGSLVIRGDGEFVDFLKVLVDGKEIAPENYTAVAGSTVITLKAEFLSTLSEGSHTFEIVWRDGSAGTHFTVARNSSGNNTGGNNGGNNTGNNNGNDNSNNSGNNAGSDNTADTTVIAPKTGDASKDALLAVLVVVSFAGFAGMLVLKKKNAYKE